MKRTTNILLLVTLLIFSESLFSQRSTNIDELNRMSQEFDTIWKEKHARVIEYSLIHDIPINFESKEGVYYELVDIIDGKPEYYRTDNHGAAVTTRANELWEGGNSGLELTGEGYNQLGEWDGGNVRVSHQEFTDQGASRVTVMDGAHATHYHATHVAGTMVAAGISNNAKGMAYGGMLKSWQWSNDESEMTIAAANGLEISNHSYGFARGWDYNNGNWQWYGNSSISPDEDYKFGFYTSDSRRWDQIALNAPYYLIVKSAGNDRGDGPSNAGNGEPEKDGGVDGYDCISPRGIAKNILTVGAVNEVLEYTGPESVTMSSFSCWGPADDGRIKPDIVGKGVGVYSPMDGSNSDYGTLQGTSMSAPNVSGSMALLQHYYQSTHNGEVMRASTLKGLVLHTTDEAGDHDGPDYIFGWGLMNSERAAAIISDDISQNVIDELVLNNGETFTREVTVPEGQELRVTICWTDPAGTPVSAQLNPLNAMLVNDLDLEIEDSKPSTFYPYSLDRDSPSAAATTTMKNYVDNVELVYIPDTQSGTFTISVSHAASLSGGSQAFSIIISGVDVYTTLPECSASLESPEDGSIGAFLNHTVTWSPALFATSYDLYFGTDGNGVSTPTNVFNGENFLTNEFATSLDPNTTYYLQVQPRNNRGANAMCGQIWSFTTMDVIDQYPYIVDMEDIITPELPEYWQSVSSSGAEWFSTSQISNTGNNSMACYNNNGLVKEDLNEWFVSPPLQVEPGNEYYIKYFYKNLLPGKSESLSLYWGISPNVEDLTNLLFEDNDYSSSDWIESGSLLTPDESGYIFLGFNMNKQQGYGGYIDDIEINDWGTVDIADDPITDNVNIYSHSGNIYIKASDNWNNATIKISNIIGQSINKSNLSDYGSTTIPVHNQPGIYIVSLYKAGNTITKKIIVK